MRLTSVLQRLGTWFGKSSDPEAVPIPAVRSVAVREQPETPQPERFVPRTPAAPALVRTEPQESQRRGRPLSASMSRTLELLNANPSITPAALAKALKVTPSYARTLLKRARTRSEEAGAGAAAPVLVPPVALHSTPAPQPALQGIVADLASRLDQAEDTLQQLRSARPTARMNWDGNRRSEVIRRSLAGESAAAISSALGVPSGEVAFILKVQQILTSAPGSSSNKL